jgi:Skp family chaperone for outer membrane proteins
MKVKLFSIVLISTIFFSASYAQITDAEKKLKAVDADTVMGWKKGGMVAINLAQTSLTNWAAGGQNSAAVNGQKRVRPV